VCSIAINGRQRASNAPLRPSRWRSSEFMLELTDGSGVLPRDRLDG